MTLRALSVTSRRRGYDSDDDYTASRNARQPINRQADQANNPAAVGAPPTNRQVRNDAWSTRMREKVMSLTVVVNFCFSYGFMVAPQSWFSNWISFLLLVHQIPTIANWSNCSCCLLNSMGWILQSSLTILQSQGDLLSKTRHPLSRTSPTGALSCNHMPVSFCELKYNCVLEVL